jgi:hypothetical protein
MMCSNVLILHPRIFDWAGNVPVGAVGFKRAKTTDGTREPRVPEPAHQAKDQAKISGHEHARGRGQRQERTEADEDLADQGALVPG